MATKTTRFRRATPRKISLLAFDNHWVRRNTILHTFVCASLLIGMMVDTEIIRRVSSFQLFHVPSCHSSISSYGVEKNSQQQQQQRIPIRTNTVFRKSKNKRVLLFLKSNDSDNTAVANIVKELSTPPTSSSSSSEEGDSGEGTTSRSSDDLLNSDTRNQQLQPQQMLDNTDFMIATQQEQQIARQNTLQEDADIVPFFATWPSWIQNTIRDSGGVRFLVNAGTRFIAAPLFYQENPWCFPEFVRVSGNEYPWLVSFLRQCGMLREEQPIIHFTKEFYGEHPHQIAQVMVNSAIPMTATTKNNHKPPPTPLFIFFHGGAWGSGFPTMYRLLSLPFLERNFRAIIIGYRTYPTTTVQGQVDDLVQAVTYFVQKYRRQEKEGQETGTSSTMTTCNENDTLASDAISDSNSTNIPTSLSSSSPPKPKIVLMGHSSGAHISMLAALQGRLSNHVDAIIAASGVYDLEQQFKYEKMAGVHEISPMSAASGFTVENLRKYSPAQQLQEKEEKRLTVTTPTSTKPFASGGGGDINAIPPVLFLHGGLDSVVLPQCSQDFFQIFNEAQQQQSKRQKGTVAASERSRNTLEIMDNIGHQEIILDTCLGGKTQSAIFDWLERTLEID